LGGKSVGLKPMNVRVMGVSHWFLQAADGQIFDLTADQFELPVPYASARGRGFLTKKASKRALILIKRAGLSLV